MGENAGRLAVLEHHVPAGARPEDLDFGEMLRRATVLAKTELVPKALQGKPEAIVLVGALGAELGIPFVTSLSEIHVIEGRPSPSAQMRLALVRRAGHDAEFLETSDERAVIRGRRRERANDPNGWVTVIWTIEQAQRAGLVDRWVERWEKSSEGRNKKVVVVVGDRDGIFTADERARRGLPAVIPPWAKAAVDAGEIKQKDNWVKYPADMLRARAASALCRMAFSDVLTGLGVDRHTADELGQDVGQDVEEPFVSADQDDDEVADGELVDDGAEVAEAPPGPAADPDADEWAAFVRWKQTGEPRNEAGTPVDVPPADTREVGENGGGAAVVGAPSTAPPLPGPALRAEMLARAAELGKSDAMLIKMAREFAGELGIDLPRSIEGVTDERLVLKLDAWLG